MSDKLGTVIGLLIGATLVIFGIIWPDHLSNYYLYQLREFEMTLESSTGHSNEKTKRTLDNFTSSFHNITNTNLHSPQ